jgi:mRNA interferase RelE/StbE
MGSYEIVFARSARRELENLDAGILDRVMKKVVGLAVNPRPPGCRKLVGRNGLWRIRVGDYRVIYAVNDDRRLVDVNAVRHRSKAYE